MKLYLLALVTFASFFSLSCSKKTEVTGEVFIVGQESTHKLPLVQITAVPEDAMKAFLASKKDEYETKEKAADATRESCEASKRYDCFREWLQNRDDLMGVYFDVYPTTWETRTETDSDGKFRLALSKSGRYALMAAGKTDGKKFYWIVWVNADGTPKSIKLSDENRQIPQPPDQILAMR